MPSARVIFGSSADPAAELGDDGAMRGAAFSLLLVASACDARSQLDVVGERSPGTGGSTATAPPSTTSATSSSGAGGATPLVACHPGDDPAVIAMNTGAWGIALDSTDVYFAGLYTQAVGRVDKLGGAVNTVATNQIAPWFVAVDGTSAYWTSSCSVAGCGMFAWAKAGGAPTQIATNPYATGSRSTTRQCTGSRRTARRPRPAR